MPPMITPVLLLLVAGLGISLPLTAMLVRAGRRLGALDTAGSTGHAKQLRAIPNIGGVAIFWAVAAPMVAGLLAISLFDHQWLIDAVPGLTESLLERMIHSRPTAAALVLCMGALHVLGLVDDRRPLGPFLKLGVQIAAACVLAIWFDVRLLTLAGPAVSITITVLWIVVMTNAINFLDNMDGLAAGVATIASILFLIAAIVNAQWFIAASLALLIGGLIGFLIFNFPPAKIFMGDGGSLVVGFLLAVLTARTTFFDPDIPDAALGGGWYGVFMPLAVLAVPIYDFTTVTTIRILQGKSPFLGDQQHFSHRLVERGLSRRGAVIVIWGATAVTGIGGISLGRLSGWQALLVGIQILVVLGVIGIFEHASRHTRDRLATDKPNGENE